MVKRLVPEGKTTCSLCSRLRRGVLYRAAAELGANKIALGHHADDIVETLFLNLFFNSSLKAMPPRLRSDDGRNVVIRPLAYLREKQIKQYAALRDFPIIPCNLCGSQPNSQRQKVKAMLAQWDQLYPGRVENVLGALGRVTPSHLMDRELFDFSELKRDGNTPNVPSPVVYDGLAYIVRENGMLHQARAFAWRRRIMSRFTRERRST